MFKLNMLYTSKTTILIKNNYLVWKNVHKVIKFIQNASLKPYTDMNTNQGEKSNKRFCKKSFTLMNYAVFGIAKESVRKNYY